MTGTSLEERTNAVGILDGISMDFRNILTHIEVDRISLGGEEYERMAKSVAGSLAGFVVERTREFLESVNYGFSPDVQDKYLTLLESARKFPGRLEISTEKSLGSYENNAVAIKELKGSIEGFASSVRELIRSNVGVEYPTKEEGTRWKG